MKRYPGAPSLTLVPFQTLQLELWKQGLERFEAIISPLAQNRGQLAELQVPQKQLLSEHLSYK